MKKIIGMFLFILILGTIIPYTTIATKMDTEKYLINDNSPPEPPTITALEKVRRGKFFTAEAVTTDPDGDDVYYRDEFNGCTGPWFGPYPSGQIYSYMMVITGAPGIYTLGVQAKDINEAESEWTYVQINVTKNKAINTPFLNFLQQHLNLFPILQKLLLLQR